VGVEGIQKAIDEFVSEQPSLNIQPKESAKTDLFNISQGTDSTLLKGDFFDLDVPSVPEEVEGNTFDLVWDRGSLVAIDPPLRAKYLNTISRVLKPGGVILLSTCERRSGFCE
jgi:thiopurine S-methyltransferase